MVCSIADTDFGINFKKHVDFYIKICSFVECYKTLITGFKLSDRFINTDIYF